MRKSSAAAAIFATFIICLGLACCSAEETKTKDQLFGFSHADMIIEVTTAEHESTEWDYFEFTEEFSEESSVNESEASPDSTTKRQFRPTRTTGTTAAASTAAPTTKPTTQPTTRVPIVTAPPDIEYNTTQPTTLPVINSDDEITMENEVFRLMNAEREKKKLPALKYSKELAAAADVRARELTQTFSHNRPDGTMCFTVSELVYGENIAAGQTTPSSVISAWMNSQGHKDNILNERYKTAAIGCYNDGESYYWVQLFGY